MNTDIHFKSTEEKKAFMCGLAFYLGIKETKDYQYVKLIFDDDIKIPEGFHWITDNGKRLLVGNKAKFCPLSNKKAKKICKSYIRRMNKITSTTECRKLLRQASSALAGYVTRNIGGQECAVLLSKDFANEVCRMFLDRYFPKDTLVEDFKKMAILQLDAMGRIPRMIKSGTDITPSNKTWHHDPEHNKDKVFYVIGAKIKTYPSGLHRIVLDLSRDVNNENGKIDIYNITFQTKLGYEKRKEGLKKNMKKSGQVKKLDFFKN